MKELQQLLENINSDNSIKSVIITSGNGSFCNGIDFTTVLQSTMEKRKLMASELSLVVR